MEIFVVRKASVNIHWKFNFSPQDLFGGLKGVQDIGLGIYGSCFGYSRTPLIRTLEIKNQQGVFEALVPSGLLRTRITLTL